jgi:hypothetical protein
LLASVCFVVLAAGTGVALGGPTGGDIAPACYAATAAASARDGRAGLACRFGQGVLAQAGADCRIVDDTDSRCAPVDGRDISSAAIATYQTSWVHQALSLQRGLDAAAPLIEEQIPHTHNTFNASAYSVPRDGSLPSYYPTLTNQDPNQVYSITDQLDMDVRAVELDLHWVPSPFGTPATHGFWVTMCHGDGQQVPNTGAYVHIGCTDDRPAQDGFAEVRRWLDGHKDQFVLIYLENQLYDAGPVAGGTLAHDTAASLLSKAFGNLVYRPSDTSPGHCATIPYGTSRAQMMATGARVLLLGNCGPGAWSSLVFQRGAAWDESGDPTTYSASDCARDRRLRASDSSFRREFEDSTFVGAATGSGPKPSMSPQNVADMVRCGVNIIGMDQLRPDDGRLAALVWSWAVNEPRPTGGCAVQGTDGRFAAADCGQQHRAACRSGSGAWSVTSIAVAWGDAAGECATEFGSSFAVPVNGYRNDVLRQARPGGVPAVWLNYAKVGGQWTPWAAGAPGAPGGPPGGGHGRGHAFGRGHGTGRPAGVPPGARPR